MLIVFEGLDGSGKTLQVSLLKKYLRQKGISYASFDFPQYQQTLGGSLVGKLLDGKYGDVANISPYLTALPYALDRFEVKNQLKKTLQKKVLVISNRYIGSSLAHQTAKIKQKKNDFIKWLMSLEYELLGIPREDLVLFLDVPPRIAKKLVGRKQTRSYTKRKRDFHEKNFEHLKRAYRNYCYLVKTLSWWKRIPCMNKNKLLEPEQIHKKILKVLKNNKVVL